MQQPTSINTKTRQNEIAALMVEEIDNRDIGNNHEMEEWDIDTPWLEFNAQLDNWARHAIAANGFGGI